MGFNESMGARGTLDRTEVLRLFAKVRRYVRHGVVAPNKSLTLLWALDRLDRGAPRLASFPEAEAELRPLLDAHGTPGTAASHAFWRLQHDGLWEVTYAAELPALLGSKEPPIGLLRAHASGGFAASVHELLATDRGLREEVVGLVADRSLGGELWSQRTAPPAASVRRTVQRLVRQAAFRREVMAAYGSCCVVCGWGSVHRYGAVGLDAAHIRPLAQGGPDVSSNGTVLCALHHALFDAGLFAYDAGRRLIVADCWAEEGRGDMPSLRRYEEALLPEPLRDAWRVHSSHLAWHRRHVFLGS